MKILSRFARAARAFAGTPAPDDDFWYTNDLSRTASGVKVTPDSAMQISAVMDCVKILAETLAQVPLLIYERQADDGKERATDMPLYELLHDQPNEWQTSFEWREMQMGHLALRGNALNEIIPGPRGRVDSLIPIHPDRVTAERLTNGRIRYTITKEDGLTKRFLSQDQVFHIRAFTSDGIWGISPIAMAAECIGLSKAAEEYGARLFQNDARPGGVITHPETLSAPARKNLEMSWNAERAGSKNAHKTAILEEGMAWTTIGIKPEEAQFLETRKFQKGEIAAIFRIPPHMVGLMDRATFSNIEQQSLEFVKYTMMPWFTRWEGAIWRDLITNTDRFFAEFLVDGLLRGDAKGRAESNQIQWKSGVLSRNEWRAMENRNPVDGGDEFDTPVDMVTPNAPQPPRPPQAMIEDAAKRIASAEIREIGKRIDKATEDRGKFNDWIRGFFQTKHRGYVGLVIAPIAAQWIQASEKVVDVGAIESALVDAAVSQWQQGEPADVWSEWQMLRAYHIETIITEGLGHGLSQSN